jgi:hypothetical protein
MENTIANICILDVVRLVHGYFIFVFLIITNPNLKENMKNEAQNAIADAIKVLHFMVQNNLPLDLFSSLVDLIVELGGDNLKKTHFLIKLSVLVHTYCPFIHRLYA